MKRILIFAFCGAAASAAFAQNLDTTTITDQLNFGSRGNNTTTGAAGQTLTATGAEAVTYSGADSTGNPVYINAYAGASIGDPANLESPVLSQVGGSWLSPDYNLTHTQTLVANNRPGATDGSKVLFIGDDGGQNTFLVGNPASANYYFKCDVLQIDNSANLATQRQVALVGIRGGRDGAPTGGAYIIDRDGAYGFIVDYQKLNIRAVKFLSGTTTANEDTENAAFTVYATTSAPAGWYTVEVRAAGSAIVWVVNGTQVASQTDSTFTNGRAGVEFRANGANGSLTKPSSALELGAFVDNIVAGPYTAPPVPAAANDWQLFN